ELKIDGGLKEGNRLVRLKMTSPAHWDVFGEAGGLTAMKGDVQIEDAALPGGSFEFPFIGSLQADRIKDEMRCEINAVLSGSKLDFRVKAQQLKSPKVEFSLTADKLDFNTLFPQAAPSSVVQAKPKADAQSSEPAPPKPVAKTPAKPDETVVLPDMSFLNAANVTGAIAIDELVVQNLAAKQFAASV